MTQCEQSLLNIDGKFCPAVSGKTCNNIASATWRSSARETIAAARRGGLRRLRLVD
jgi:hypothetical protein